MAYTFVMLLAFGAYLGWFYWNRAKNIRDAGGAAEFGQTLYRKQFGLAPNENLTQYFTGHVYLGSLRPDVGPSKAEKVVAAIAAQSFRGVQLAFALTDQDRLAVATERDDSLKLRERLDALKGEDMGMDPMLIFNSNGKPLIRLGVEAFAGHPELPPQNKWPERVGMSGQKEHFVLLHIEPMGAKPLTVWIDPLGAKALIAWSQLAAPAFVAQGATS